MRKSGSASGVTAQAVAGTYSVLLGFDATPAVTKGLLGFAIHRQDHTANTGDWLHGLKTFQQTDPGTPTVSLAEQPVQAFLWGDYTATPGHKYTYQVVAVHGTPAKPVHSAPVTLDIQTETATGDGQHVFFNRGVAGSQAFVRKFGEPTLADLNKPNSPARVWLSRGLEEAILAFIAQAADRTWAIRGSLYEFTYPPLLAAFKAAHGRGADVKLVVDDHGAPIEKENRPAIQAAGLSDLVIPRNGQGQGISHNKFIVLLKDGKPVSVWTGSTNITEGGLLGQSNVGHAVPDPAVAAIYLKYWTEIATNPAHVPFCKWNDDDSAVAADSKHPSAVRAIFSPRGSLQALDYYTSLLAGVKQAAFFTEAFGICKEFTPVLTKRDGKLRYILMDNKGQTGNEKNYETVKANPFTRIGLGDFVHKNTFGVWHEEHLIPGLNSHVRYVHTKYLLADPLGPNPIVVTGSANFSDASTTANDENMLVVPNDSRVADIYLTEFMRLFETFRWRDVLDTPPAPQGKPTPRSAGYLVADDSWVKPHYEPGSPRAMERQYFAGTLK
jgi:phosphatidylserine/phosphatidylglycerophosphate/cardiolipin synthase-like enzyme